MQNLKSKAYFAVPTTRRSEYPPFLKQEKKGLVLYLSAQPGAKKSGWAGKTEDGYLRLRLKARAEKGKANQELVEILVRELKIPRSSIKILSGEHSRKKRILIMGIDGNQVFRQLQGLAQEVRER